MTFIFNQGTFRHIQAQIALLPQSSCPRPLSEPQIWRCISVSCQGPDTCSLGPRAPDRGPPPHSTGYTPTDRDSTHYRLYSYKQSQIDRQTDRHQLSYSPSVLYKAGFDLTVNSRGSPFDWTVKKIWRFKFGLVFFKLLYIENGSHRPEHHTRVRGIVHPFL